MKVGKIVTHQNIDIDAEAVRQAVKEYVLRNLDKPVPDDAEIDVSIDFGDDISAWSGMPFDDSPLPTILTGARVTITKKGEPDAHN